MNTSALSGSEGILQNYLVDLLQALPRNLDAHLRTYQTLQPLWLVTQRLRLAADLCTERIPAIMRQTQVKSVQTRRRSAPPVHNTIDWERSFADNPLPGEPPLHLTVQERRRDTSTPENRLAVIALALCRHDLQTAHRLFPALQQLGTLSETCSAFLRQPPLLGISIDAYADLAEMLQQLIAQIDQSSLAHPYSTLRDWCVEWLALRPLSSQATEISSEWLYTWFIILLTSNTLPDSTIDWNTQPLPTITIYRNNHSFTLACEANARLLKLQRNEPEPLRVVDGESVVWQESGVLFLPSFNATDSQAATDQLKGACARLGQRFGVALFGDYVALSEDDCYRQINLPPNTSDPGITLLNLFDWAIECIGATPDIRCHGIFLDSTGIAEHPEVTGTEQHALETNDEWLICPKPHMSEERRDIVLRSRDCCRNAHVCHIINQPGAQPPIRTPHSPSDVAREFLRLKSLPFAETEPHGDIAPERLEHLALVSLRFAEFSGFEARQLEYEHRLRDLGLYLVVDAIPQSTRRSLALALFLADRLDLTAANDYSAPSIHLAIAVEREVQRTVFSCPMLRGKFSKRRYQTLGMLPYMQHNPHLTEGNWRSLSTWIAERWQMPLLLGDSSVTVGFEQFAQSLRPVAHIRNRAAHTVQIDRTEYSMLLRTICQSGVEQVGLLTVLLGAWRNYGIQERDDLGKETP